MSKELAFVKEFTISKRQPIVILDKKRYKLKLTVLEKLSLVQDFYRGYIYSLDNRNKKTGRKVSFKWAKLKKSKYQIKVFADPKFVLDSDENTGSGTQNPPFPKTPPPTT